MKYAKSLIGLRFGKLLVLERAPNKNKQIMWHCQCDCGNSGICYATHLKKGATKSCGCSMITKGSAHVQWTGCGEISGQRWVQIKGKSMSARVSRNGQAFDITIDFAWRLFLEQNRRCKLSGVPIWFGKSNTEKTTASLDRIDSTKGYLEDNVQWVHKDVNLMKNVLDQDLFIEMCWLIARESGAQIGI